MASVVGCAAVASIRDQSQGTSAGVGLDPLDHRQQVHGITGLVADADSHDHLVVAIDGGLGVVGLNPAVNTFEDVAVGIGDNPLGLGLGEAGGIGAELPSRHRPRIARGIARGSVEAEFVGASSPAASAFQVASLWASSARLRAPRARRAARLPALATP
jgi:hypothetical protein